MAKNYLSLGGRIALLNAVSSIIPLYIVFEYRVPTWAIGKIDQIKRKFLSKGPTGEGRSYNLIS